MTLKHFISHLPCLWILPIRASQFFSHMIWLGSILLAYWCREYFIVPGLNPKHSSTLNLIYHFSDHISLSKLFGNCLLFSEFAYWPIYVAGKLSYVRNYWLTNVYVWVNHEYQEAKSLPPWGGTVIVTGPASHAFFPTCLLSFRYKSAVKFIKLICFQLSYEDFGMIYLVFIYFFQYREV